MNAMNPTNPTTIGILSDTHGLLRPEVEQALSGCGYILHAGDVGEGQVLTRLERIAPVMAVRGNMDYGSWTTSLPIKEMAEIEGIFFYILHDLHQLDLEPSAAGIQVVVSGHTHRPEIFEKNGVTYLNPGSAGHRRFNYPVSIARVRIENGVAMPRIIELDV
jgi:putative phosphoesterase